MVKATAAPVERHATEDARTLRIYYGDRALDEAMARIAMRVRDSDAAGALYWLEVRAAIGGN